MQQCRIAALAASQHSGRLPTEFSNANFRSIVSKQSKISIPAGADHGRVLRSDGSRDNQQGAASAPVTFCCEVLNIITAHSLLTKRMPAPVGLLIANGKEFVSAPRTWRLDHWAARVIGSSASSLIGAVLYDALSSRFSTGGIVVAIADPSVMRGHALRPRIRFMPLTSIRSRPRTMQSTQDHGPWLGWPC